MIPLRDNLSCKSAARVTFALIALNLLAFLVQAVLPDSMQVPFLLNFAVIPARITFALASHDPIAIGLALSTVFTAMFLHGGIGHILGNMIFLQAFGRAVENRFGSWRFLGFYLCGGFAAWALHYAIDPLSRTPALGASGAIAAVLGAYLWFYPKAEFRTLFLVPLPILADVRAYWLLVVWIVSQLIPGVKELLEPSVGAGVAYWAHIGGFVAGLAAAAVFARRNPLSAECYQQIECDCTCGKKGFKGQVLSFFNMGKTADCHTCNEPQAQAPAPAEPPAVKKEGSEGSHDDCGCGH